MARMDWDKLEIIECSTDEIADQNGEDSLKEGEQTLFQLAQIFSKAFERRHSKGRGDSHEFFEERMAA